MENRTLVTRINEELAHLNPAACLPEDAVIPEFSTVKRFGRPEIDERIPERPPFNYFLYAAIVGDGSGTKPWVFAPCDIPVEKCAGHFPDYPMVPLHVLGGAMALTSTLLVGHVMREMFPSLDEPFYPLAVEGSRVAWTGGRRLLVPPVTTVITAEFLEYDEAKNAVRIRTKVWSTEKAVALIEPLEFSVIPKRFFDAMYRRSVRSRSA